MLTINTENISPVRAKYGVCFGSSLSDFKGVISEHMVRIKFGGSSYEIAPR